MLQSQPLSRIKGVGHVIFSQSGAACPLTGSSLTGGGGCIRKLFELYTEFQEPSKDWISRTSFSTIRRPSPSEGQKDNLIPGPLQRGA